MTIPEEQKIKLESMQIKGIRKRKISSLAYFKLESKTIPMISRNL